MTDDLKLQLISDAIDGELSASDQAELDRLLETSPEAREFKAELEQLDSLLSAVPDLELPASLHARIMAHAKPPVEQSKPSVLEWLRPLKLGAGLRYALAVSTGALLVVVLFDGQKMLSGTTAINDVVGTIAPESASADADIIDTFTFRGYELESTVRLERSNDILYLNVDIDAKAALDIAVDLSGADLQPDAVAQLDSNFDSIVIAPQAVQIRGIGRQRLTILLRRVGNTAVAGEAKITLEFSSDGKLLQQGALKPTW